MREFFAEYVLNDHSQKGIDEAYFHNCDIKILEISPN